MEASDKPIDWGGNHINVLVTDLRTHMYQFLFDWGKQFGPYPDEADPWTRVLWRKDSRAFAFSFVQARGAVGCRLFLRTAGKWTECTLPDLAASDARFWKVDRNLVGGKGHEIALSWDSSNTVLVDVGYRGAESTTLIKLEVVERNGKAYGRIKSIVPLSDDIDQRLRNPNR